MKLFYAPVSPFARKVRILAQEIGLEARLELVAVNPWTEETLRAHNPLCQVPTLIADDGVAIYDSRVICLYLDGLAGAGRVAGAPIASLVLEALADGVCDGAVRHVTEGRRPEAERNVAMLARQTQAMNAGLDEAERSLTPDRFDIGEIALVCTFIFLDFRLPQYDWRQGRPRLQTWFETMNARPSVVATEPAR
jgi:glutathione S-transferase